MATVTEYDAATTASTSNTNTYASAAFTPAVGDLLVVAVISSGTVDAGDVTVSANGVSSFTRVDRAVYGPSVHSVYLFVADQLTTGTASMTVTFDCTGDNATGAIVMVSAVVGMSKTGATAIKQSTKVDDGAGGTAPSFVFPGNCLTGNVTIYAIGEISTAGMLTPTNWTQGDQTSYSTPTIGGSYGYRASGFTGNTINWPGNETAHGGVFVELDTSSSGVTGSGAATAQVGDAAGSGSLSLTGSGAATAAVGDAAAAASLSLTGTGAAVAQAVVSDGAGTVAITGTGTPTAPAAQTDGTGSLGLTGAATATASAGVADGAGTLSLTGSGASTAQAGVADGTGNVGAVITGSGTATGQPGQADGAGGLTVTGTGAATGSSADATGAGALTVTGTGAALATTAEAEGAATLTVLGVGAAVAQPGEASGRDVVYETPAERTLIVSADTRVQTIPADDRTTTILAETRRTTVPAENRVTSIPAEDRAPLAA